MLKKKICFSRRETGTIRMTQNLIINDSKQLNIAYSKPRVRRNSFVFCNEVLVMGCGSKETIGKNMLIFLTPLCFFFVGFKNYLK